MQESLMQLLYSLTMGQEGPQHVRVGGVYKIVIPLKTVVCICWFKL